VPIRLAIVDDHPAIAGAIAGALAVERDEGDRIEVVRVARTVGAGISLVSDPGTRPDVVLCDVQLESGADGLQVLDAAVEVGCRVIVLTGHDRASLMRSAFERGAVGFLDKGAEVAEIVAAVRRVAAGGTAFSADALFATRTAPRVPSARELAVIEGVGSGFSSDEIGARLGISARTVESHLRRLFDRYGVLSRTELAVFAVHEGWISGVPRPSEPAP
jgi:DNA-binding NarL/FixJ family response regulator